MTNKLKIIQDFETQMHSWDERAKKVKEVFPLKGMRNLPFMPGITPETAKGLKWKSFKWMLLKDRDFKVIKGVFHRPFTYGWRYLKSLFLSKEPFKREGDFFLYGLNSIKEMDGLLQDPKRLFVVGFSYCHKPFECPSGRFTDQCANADDNPVCQQCFIGKAKVATKDAAAIVLIIPTVHYIGAKIFEIAHQNPGKKISFLITACELTLKMFGDWGNMVGIQGVGVRLDGRICNTMRAFALSEEGIKPGLTVVLDETQEKMLSLIKRRRETITSHKSF